ncbi:MAG: CRISPR-associated helicase Cas3' [Pseudonocardiaceae bacterium]
MNKEGRRHALVDHLRDTAELAGRFAEPFGAGHIAWWAGLLHDAGKASCAWQEGLLRVEGTDKPVGVEHRLLGTRLARDRGLGKLALAVQGHHGGLTCPRDISDRLAELSPARLDQHEDAERRLRMLLPELSLAEKVPLPAEWAAEPLVAEMGLRLVFSALCDADFLDTAAHFAGASKPAVRADVDFAALLHRFETERIARLAHRGSRSAMDATREQIYQSCVAFASSAPGIFRLPAPTGSGKTLSSAGFALHHAARYGMRRVIVAVPFLTITEQNAAVYRDHLDDQSPGGDRVVLEHHSQVDLDSEDPARRWERLAAENWDAPFVVTTNVRLFEALFGRKPAAMRRVHRLAGAVLVLDEVQALPHRLLVPILDALRTLVTHFGTTVLLSSATQPDFWHLSPFRDLDSTEILVKPPTRTPARRVCFEWRTDPSPTLHELAAEAAGYPQALVVVNTTGNAAQVLECWRGQVNEGVAWHLSTRMCPAHRYRVLETVRSRLADGKPTLLVSTQLIEAGVDVDFPVVYRALAPADSLLQAAGRANREGNLPQPGRVIIVDPPDGKQPPSYSALVNATRVHFGPDKANPDNSDVLRNYYHDVYGSLNLESDDHVGKRIQASRKSFDFAAVTDGPADPATQIRDRSAAFRMITDEGIALVTPKGGADTEKRQMVMALLAKIRSEPGRPEASALRELRPYITTVHRSALRQPGVLALMEPVLGERGQPGSLAEWIGEYDDDTGIALDPHWEEFTC